MPTYEQNTPADLGWLAVARSTRTCGIGSLLPARSSAAGGSPYVPGSCIHRSRPAPHSELVLLVQRTCTPGAVHSGLQAAQCLHSAEQAHDMADPSKWAGCLPAVLKCARTGSCPCSFCLAPPPYNVQHGSRLCASTLRSCTGLHPLSKVCQQLGRFEEASLPDSVRGGEGLWHLPGQAKI